MTVSVAIDGFDVRSTMTSIVSLKEKRVSGRGWQFKMDGNVPLSSISSDAGVSFSFTR